MPLTNFQKGVYNITQQIPKGRVTTYQAVAGILGNKNLARAVGNALNKNPFSSHRVPCHRVVKLDRSLGGYASGAKIKKKLLLKEGIKFEKNGKIAKKYFFRLVTKL